MATNQWQRTQRYRGISWGIDRAFFPQFLTATHCQHRPICNRAHHIVFRNADCLGTQ